MCIVSANLYEIVQLMTSAIVEKREKKFCYSFKHSDNLKISMHATSSWKLLSIVNNTYNLTFRPESTICCIHTTTTRGALMYIDHSLHQCTTKHTWNVTLSWEFYKICFFPYTIELEKWSCISFESLNHKNVKTVVSIYAKKNSSQRNVHFDHKHHIFAIDFVKKNKTLLWTLQLEFIIYFFFFACFYAIVAYHETTTLAFSQKNIILQMFNIEISCFHPLEIHISSFEQLFIRAVIIFILFYLDERSHSNIWSGELFTFDVCVAENCPNMLKS